MATKTISIEVDVYDMLRDLKATPSESFSQVLRRELSRPKGMLASDLLHRANRPGGVLRVAETRLNDIEAVRDQAQKWDDPWKKS